MAEAKSVDLDFSNVKEGGKFRKVRQRAGDHRGRIMAVSTVKKKKDGKPQWEWVIKVGPGTYPYYTAFEENQLWKIRNLFVAAGKSVPKKRVRVNPNNIVGKDIGVILIDDDYDGKEQSSIDSVVPLSDISDTTDLPDDDSDDEDEDTPAPAADDDDDEAEDSDTAAPADDDEDLDSLDVEEL